tara:strand:- start:6522 stop:7328 length:807 start_codon:yes stop_codon:yes gene_type:complete
MSTENINTFQEDGETQEYVDQMLEKGEQIEANNDPNQGERPEWLPEKFNSAEDMAEAYANLEQKLGQGDEPEQEYEYEDEVVDEDVEYDENTDAGDVETALDASGLDFDVFQQEYNELGGLSDDAYSALQEAGFPQSLVDSWIQGQEALVNNYQQSVYDSVGGQEAYSEMIGWAADNMSPQEIAAYDRAVDSGDSDMVQLAISGLRSMYQSAEGSDPSLIGGQATSSTGGIYNSWAEVTSDMSDPRYESDPAYRQTVTNKLGRSGNIQ